MRSFVAAHFMTSSNSASLSTGWVSAASAAGDPCVFLLACCACHVLLSSHASAEAHMDVAARTQSKHGMCNWTSSYSERQRGARPNCRADTIESSRCLAHPPRTESSIGSVRCVLQSLSKSLGHLGPLRFWSIDRGQIRRSLNALGTKVGSGLGN